MKRLILILIIFIPITLFGQTVAQIDSICLSIDNRNFIEAIMEGEFTNKTGGWDAYLAKDDKGNLYRTKYTGSTSDTTNRQTFYYNNKKVIKAIITIAIKSKTIYSAIYYYQDNIPIKIIGENKKYSNPSSILKQGLKFE